MTIEKQNELVLDPMCRVLDIEGMIREAKIGRDIKLTLLTRMLNEELVKSWNGFRAEVAWDSSDDIRSSRLLRNRPIKELGFERATDDEWEEVFDRARAKGWIAALEHRPVRCKWPLMGWLLTREDVVLAFTRSLGLKKTVRELEL